MILDQEKFLAEILPEFVKLNSKKYKRLMKTEEGKIQFQYMLEDFIKMKIHERVLKSMEQGLNNSDKSIDKLFKKKFDLGE